MSDDHKPSYEDFFNLGNAGYFATAECFKGSEVRSPGLRVLLDLREIDLKPLSRLIVDDSKDDDFVERLCRSVHSYTQFQDLLGITFQSKGELPKQLFNRNYCYYESLVYLREILRAWLDGNVLAAAALQRPFLELSIFHLYWRWKIDNGELTDYYNWLEGKGHKPGFAKMIDETILNLEARSLVEENRVDRVKVVLMSFFGAHSSYNHTPLLSESLTRMNHGMGKLAPEAFWKVPAELEIMINQLIFLYILAHPMAMFPVNLLRKFGCSGPMNLFFDETSFRILKAYLGDGNVTGLKAALSRSENVKSLLDWYESFPDKGDEQIWEEWATSPDQIKSDFEPTSLEQMSAMLKAQKRAMCWMLAYKDLNFPENEEDEISGEMLNRRTSFLRDW